MAEHSVKTLFMSSLDRKKLYLPTGHGSVSVQRPIIPQFIAPSRIAFSLAQKFRQRIYQGNLLFKFKE
jgi:hypothetical protein